MPEGEGLWGSLTITASAKFYHPILVITDDSVYDRGSVTKEGVQDEI